jgi:hypothetical protein
VLTIVVIAKAVAQISRLVAFGVCREPAVELLADALPVGLIDPVEKREARFREAELTGVRSRPLRE